jgi:hypothetical protein
VIPCFICGDWRTDSEICSSCTAKMSQATLERLVELVETALESETCVAEEEE